MLALLHSLTPSRLSVWVGRGRVESALKTLSENQPVWFSQSKVIIWPKVGFWVTLLLCATPHWRSEKCCVAHFTDASKVWHCIQQLVVSESKVTGNISYRCDDYTARRFFLFFFVNHRFIVCYTSHPKCARLAPFSITYFSPLNYTCCLASASPTSRMISSSNTLGFLFWFMVSSDQTLMCPWIIQGNIKNQVFEFMLVWSYQLDSKKLLRHLIWIKQNQKWFKS